MHGRARQRQPSVDPDLFDRADVTGDYDVDLGTLQCSKRYSQESSAAALRHIEPSEQFHVRS